MNAIAILTLLEGVIGQASSIASLLGLVQTQKRDATPAEWAALLDADAKARAALVAAIAAAQATAKR